MYATESEWVCKLLCTKIFFVLLLLKAGEEKPIWGFLSFLQDWN